MVKRRRTSEDGGERPSCSVSLRRKSQRNGDEEKGPVLNWVGPPKTLHEQGTKFYSAVQKEAQEEVWRVGDVVSVLTEPSSNRRNKKFVEMSADGKEVSIGVLESLWESREDQEKMCEIRWFVRPYEDQVPPSIAKNASLRSELFEGNAIDEIEVDCIHEKVCVEPPDVYMDVKTTRKKGTRGTPLYFCKSFFHDDLKIIRTSNLFKTPPGFHSKRFPYQKGTDEDQQRTEEDKFLKAMRRFQLSSIPDSLPCREKERDQIYNFLHDALNRKGDGSGANTMYISGMPGAGKTATVKEIIGSLRTLSDAGSISRFDFVEINAMKLAHPYHAYSDLWYILTNERINHTRAAQNLEQMFSNGERDSVCVLLVDELDFMVTRKQTVLYNLFDWPSRPGSKFVVVGIANTMNLPEKLLPRINSRLGGRVVFPSYTRDQLIHIMEARLAGLEVFEADAVQMCARKIASVSGDVRKALQICRTAVEICQRENAEQVSVDHIMKAAKQATNNIYLEAIQQASLLQKIVLVAIYKYKRTNDHNFSNEPIEFDHLWHRINDLWKQFGIRHASKITSKSLIRFQVISCIKKLGQSNVVLVREARDQREPTIQPQMDYEEIKIALEDDEHCKTLFGAYA